MKTQSLTLWQISCSECGMSTLPDESRAISLKRWNFRSRHSLKSFGGVVALSTFFLMAVAFIAGLAMGAGIGS